MTKLSGRVEKLPAAFWMRSASRTQPRAAFRRSAILVLVAVVATTGSAHGSENATKRALVWSTSVMVERTPNHWVEKPSLWIGAPDASRPRLLGEGRRPRLSPDGRWVAFERESSVHVVSSAGDRSVLVVRKARLVRWSPTSRHLAIVGDDVRGLWVVDVRTGRRVTIEDDASIYGASFSPSGAGIVWGAGARNDVAPSSRVASISSALESTARRRPDAGRKQQLSALGPARHCVQPRPAQRGRPLSDLRAVAA